MEMLVCCHFGYILTHNTFIDIWTGAVYDTIMFQLTNQYIISHLQPIPLGSIFVKKYVNDICVKAFTYATIFFKYTDLLL